ncbi:MAG: di-trans,poly-cis-decaprenylcistransferase [Lentisphaerae bacterium]|nr:di-trans,poly-cis-decaprenylcistransferase [Lentisphaerota bacterium]
MNDLPEVKHVAIIMDGNGRWAKKHDLPRVEGHKKGADTVEDLLTYIYKYGVKYLTLYAFSTENWKRSEEEVNALMSLLSFFLQDKKQKMLDNKIRLRVTGRIDGLPEEVANSLREVMAETAKNYEYTLILALNYGGRAEIVDAAKKFAEECITGKISPESLDESIFKQYLYLPDVPDPELMIRTSGELRLSNFLLWELSYSEIFVTDTLWPDFSEEEFRRILENFGKRDRRFGGRK